jgi:hypothetical protein
LEGHHVSDSLRRATARHSEIQLLSAPAGTSSPPTKAS